jgi:uncharacterized protein YjgD (DUF1641 family)
MHPRIDSGFIVTLADNDQDDPNGGGVPAKFKIGVEMQVRDEGNMGARIVDYGTRIFRFKKTEEGFLKTYELALVRWSVQNAMNTILLAFGVPFAACDPSVSADMVESPVCCAQIFLGASVDIMGGILGVLQEQFRNRPGDSLTEENKAAVRKFISEAKDEEKRVLIDQMRNLLQKDLLEFDQWTEEEKDCVNRIGFFKYGHLMSDVDVDALDDADLKSDYECIKINEENIVNNMDEIKALWGSVKEYTRDALIEKINEKDREIAELRKQLENTGENSMQERPLELRKSEKKERPRGAHGSGKKRKSKNERKRKRVSPSDASSSQSDVNRSGSDSNDSSK